MYQAPMIYSGQHTISNEDLKKADEPEQMLALMHTLAMERMVERANANSDYLSPDSVMVTIRIEGRAL